MMEIKIDKDGDPYDVPGFSYDNPGWAMKMEVADNGDREDALTKALEVMRFLFTIDGKMEPAEFRRRIRLWLEKQ